MKILRVNMRTKATIKEELPREWELYGCRGLVAKVLLKEVPPACEPLGPFNKLVFANGPMAFPNVSSAGRFSAGGKSPLTGGIKEANSGGIAGLRLAGQGFRAVIIEDKPENREELYVLHIGRDRIRLENAAEYKLMGVHELAEKLFARYGKDVSLTMIGPAGEMLMSSAAIVNVDKDGNPSRCCARGGLGAVMGSKGLKAVVVENDGDFRQEIKDPKKFNETVKAYAELLRTSHQTSVAYTLYGTAGLIATINELGGMTSYAFRSGSFDKVEEITGEKLYDVINERGGEGTPTHACMPGCLIRSSNVFAGKDGKKKVASFEYETIAMLGSNLGIGNFDEIAELNYLCNDYGIDTIEIGAALGVYMDLGLARFGDAAAAAGLIKEVGSGTLLGKVLGEGAAVTARIFKSLRAPVAKGQSIAAHEPRSIKGMSVTYATSPMGADHTAGVTTRAKVNQLDPNGQMELSRSTQVRMAAVDTLGVCMFVTTAGMKALLYLVEMLNAVYGTEHTVEFINKLGKDVILTEREFNTRAGFNGYDDRMPEFMMYEAIPPHNAVSDIPKEHYKLFWDDDYWKK
ncbi:MAG: aldehyde ferredoxin oxidoreductase C-terminal domain-containing protein [Peptococcaceae bacterium]|jgi:aldehyde:ferredoxin oxidoreductase|nr:aldehyde ferredoxin oxidoreductase [Peptococcaceae bacterium]MDH7525399.1 aldehyde ferredoxin oxidoreductase C-terminal domain-containing protein [Peptococcaceae bacterium]